MLWSAIRLWWAAWTWCWNSGGIEGESQSWGAAWAVTRWIPLIRLPGCPAFICIDNYGGALLVTGVCIQSLFFFCFYFEREEWPVKNGAPLL